MRSPDNRQIIVNQSSEIQIQRKLQIDDQSCRYDLTGFDLRTKGGYSRSMGCFRQGKH